ncbi:hypothetical protein [Plantibacter sp. YIM 135249]|uniref:hypothetical protein n=1 Tax=Plantibacter sp. YIM 135249 TaxID=3423918 RepID=UPI003D326206
MIAAALLLFLVGSADLVRARGNAIATWCIVPIAWAGALWFTIAVRTPLWAWILAVAVAVFWWSTMRRRGSADAPRLGLVPVAVLLVTLAALVLFAGGLPQPEWRIDGWTLDSPDFWILGAPATGVAMAIAVTLFLLESANVLVRAALRDELEDAESTPSPTPPHATAHAAATHSPRARARRRRWWQQPAPAPESISEQPPAAQPSRVSTLKGGRLIGPLERLVLVALLLTNAYAVVAAIIAAKGIVRFPEISKDGATGRNAETFLVGSMVSWALAVGAAGLVWLAFH